MKRKGKLITVWVPGNHGAGGSTVADGIGIMLQHFLGLKTLIVNFSGKRSYLERFLQNDVDVSYSIDYLKSFGSNIEMHEINTFATKLNDRLSIIAGSALRDGSGADNGFNEILLDRCLEGFDFVIADVEAGFKEGNKLFLNRADVLVAVMTPNEIMLDDIFNEIINIPICSYLNHDKTIPVFNMMYENGARELKRLIYKYGFKSAFGLEYDIKVFNACCKDRKLYSFIKESLKRDTDGFVEQMDELCVLISERLGLDCYRKREREHRVGSGLLGFAQLVKKDEKIYT